MAEKKKMGIEEKRLYKKADALISKKEFDKVIELLTPEILLRVNSGRLYCWKGIAYHELKQYDDAIAQYNKAIEIRTDDAVYYYNIGLSLFHKKILVRALPYFSKAIELDPNDFTYHDMRGNCYFRLRGYNNAFDDFEKAISISPNTAELYHHRGLCWRIRGANDLAIKDFSKAIELDSNNSDFFCDRGISYTIEKDLKSANKDFTTAISLNPTDFKGYYNLGTMSKDSGNLDLAIDYFRKSLTANPDNSGTYTNLGIIFELKNDYPKALDEYDNALKINPNDIAARNNRDKIKALLGERIDVDTSNNTTSLQLFVRVVNDINIDPKIRNKILQICAETKQESIDKIRAFAGKGIYETAGIHVVHYTNLKVADLIANNETRHLRYYNAIYMNDPEEGQVVLNCLDNEVKMAFDNANLQEEGNIYIGSFLPAKKHEDELVMWRTYGKDEHQTEGAGCSITINTKFFDDYSDGQYINPQFISDDTNQASPRHNLFRVLYYNKNHHKDNNMMFNCTESNEIQYYIEKLNKGLLKLIKLKDNKDQNSRKNKTIDKIIYHLISEIRFFFKSSDYSFENEVRVLQYTDKSSDQLKIDERSTSPKKVYIESNKEIQSYIETITLGPKVPNPKQWLYLDVAMRKNNKERETPVEFIISQRKYQ